MIDIVKKVPLLNCEDKLYKGVIFKKCFYNFLNSKFNKIDFYSCYLNKISSSEICNSYISITSSKDKQLYYVTKISDNENIYIIDNEYNEIDKIKLNIPNNYKSDIKAITFDEEKSKILIALKNKIYSVTTDGDFIKEELSKSSLEKISTKYSKIEVIRGLNGSSYNSTKPVYEPCFTSVGIFCSRTYITYIKDNSLYLSEISNNGNIVDTFYIDDDVEVNAIIDVNKNMQMLVTKQEKYNYIYITDYCIKEKECKCNYCLECDNCYDQEYYLENEDNYFNIDCLEYNHECNHDCCNGCKNKDTDIIKSIALVETALSHILNVEGEKIEKAVCISENVTDLIKVNESVSKTITNITLLEQILLSKLELVHDK